ncbi:MAG: hypothetical protein ACYS7Y_28040 [Planctomycetota bacterium]
MKCPHCGTTWTVRVRGIDHGRQRSDRLIAMGVLLYMLGLSYRNVETFLHAFGWKGSKSSIERDLARSGQKAKALHMQAPAMQVRILGVDGTGAKMAGKKAGLLFFVDIERQRLLSVEPINEIETRRLRRHVQRVIRLLGVEELRTDELNVYRHIVPEPMHRICIAHWLKSKCRRAWELFRKFRSEGMRYEADTMLKLIKLLHLHSNSTDVPPEIERLVRRFINCHSGLLWKANQLLQHIERTWPSVSRDPIDATNNTTERIIGLTYKIRAKTMRGFKSPKKALAHPHLAQFIRGTDGICDFSQVI